MLGTFVCRNVKRNNGVVQVHLTADAGAPHQPTEILINVEDSTALYRCQFVEDRRYFVEISDFPEPVGAVRACPAP